ncbi:MAG: hypothetical protein AAGK02_00350 [Pseudomonadota bacterium]
MAQKLKARQTLEEILSSCSDTPILGQHDDELAIADEPLMIDGEHLDTAVRSSKIQALITSRSIAC